MSVFKTEITSDTIQSDNPIHQRLLKPYKVVKDEVNGNLLELGCGEGRGVEELLPFVETYMGLDKIGSVVDNLKIRFPKAEFMQSIFPPVPIMKSGCFDFIISFQVIEHVKDDRLFLEEVYRLLKPGGVAMITTPNIKMSFSRNPWHIREYTIMELQDLTARIFDEVVPRGISGNDKVMQYYEENRRSVERIMKFDVLDLQHRLPAFLLKIPYEILNRMNRNKLKKQDDQLVGSITTNDYIITDDTEHSLDLFFYLYKRK